jgi:hypothetical protein
MLLLLAGCASPGGPPAPGVVPAPILLAGPTFEAPVRIASVGPEQGEFPLAVSPDGATILACTHGGFTGPAPKAVSRDGGRTWTMVQPQPTPGASGDCWADLGDDGTWYFVDSQVAANTVSSSHDQGASWIVNRLASPPIGGTADRPYMVPLGGARMGLTFVQDYLAPGYVVFTQTADRGATWSAPMRITGLESTRANVMHGPPMVSDDRRTVLVPTFQFGTLDYPRGGAARGDLVLMVSPDGGGTWQPRTARADVAALFTPPAFARAGDGRLYWAFQTQNGSQQDIQLLTSADDGRSWQGPSRIAGGWAYIGYMWMDAARDGSAVLSFDADGGIVDPRQAGERLILIGLDAQAAPALSWTNASTRADNSEFSTVALDGSGRIFSGYRDQGSWLVLREKT